MSRLKFCKLAAGLPPSGLEALEAAACSRSYQPGDLIFQEHDPGDGLFILLEGAVEISILLEGGSRAVLARLGPGDWFGEMALFDSAGRSAAACALDRTDTFFLSREVWEGLIQQFPGLALNLLREISNRLRQFNARYVQEQLQTERLSLLGRFTRAIIHDLKNPLSIISLSTELLGMPGRSEELHQTSCRRILKQVGRVNSMISELLEFSRGGPIPLETGPVDYPAFLQEILEELRPDLNSRSIQVNFDSFPESIPVRLDPKRFARVLLNLVNNAAEAMPDGGSIQIRVREEANMVRSEIEDNGPGIAPEVVQRLFEPFATHGKVNGTGLGLSICRRIVEDHGGWITGGNRPERGAVFTVALPVQPPVPSPSSSA